MLLLDCLAMCQSFSRMIIQDHTLALFSKSLHMPMAINAKTCAAIATLLLMQSGALMDPFQSCKASELYVSLKMYLIISITRCPTSGEATVASSPFRP